jgi:hypothetical protein
VIGTVYLLHLEPGLRITGARAARHHIGYTALPVEDRLAQHLAGRDSPLVAAVISAAGAATLQRTRNDTNRQFERARGRRHEAARVCPHRINTGHTGGRGLLLNRAPQLTPTRPGPTLSR